MNARARTAALLSATVLVLAGCGDDPTVTDPGSADGPTGKHRSRDASTAPSTDLSTDAGSPTAEPSEGTSGTTVPVYYAGRTPDGRRLFREFRRVDGAPLDGALTLAAGESLDPDYRSLLPTGTFSGATADGSIPLPDDSWTRRPPGMSMSQALLAVQQLVYTAQGVLQKRAPITFTDGDGNATQIFGIASEDGFTAADPIRTLALMNITTPEQGQTVSGSFTAEGVGSSFEATVPWELRRGDRVVKKGSTTAEGWMDRLYPWQARVDVSGLQPGEYTFVAMTDDPSADEGPGPTADSKTIVVG